MKDFTAIPAAEPMSWALPLPGGGGGGGGGGSGPPSEGGGACEGSGRSAGALRAFWILHDPSEESGGCESNHNIIGE